MISIVILISLTYSANIVRPFDGRRDVPTFSDVQSFDGYCRSGQPSLCKDSGEFQVVDETFQLFRMCKVSTVIADQDSLPCAKTAVSFRWLARLSKVSLESSALNGPWKMLMQRRFLGPRMASA